MQLVLDTKGLQLSKKGGSFYVVGDDEKKARTISPEKLSSIAVTATVWIGSDAVRLAIQKQVPILFFDNIGKATARLWSPYFGSIATLRRQQLRFTEGTEATAWLIELFSLKTEGQVDNLKYIKGQRKGLNLALSKATQTIKKHHRSFERFRDVLPEECRQQMMGVEGNIARLYWQAVGNSLPRKYAFQERSRRPAKDFFNAALNYLYGMTYSVIESGLLAAGLDPHLGMLHADEYNKSTLTFDLIEPFRPWVDRLLIEQCFENKIDKAFFTKNQYGLFLNKTGKAFIIPLFNDFLRSERSFLNQESNVKNHVYFLMQKLAQRIRYVEGG